MPRRSAKQVAAQRKASRAAALARQKESYRGKAHGSFMRAESAEMRGDKIAEAAWDKKGKTYSKIANNEIRPVGKKRKGKGNKGIPGVAADMATLRGYKPMRFPTGLDSSRKRK